MRLHTYTAAFVSRHHPADSVRPVRCDVRCWDDRVDRERLVGRLTADHLLWGAAVADGASLVDICDNASARLHDLHAALTGGADDLPPGLRAGGPVAAVVFVHAAVFHPGVWPYRAAALDAVFNLFGPDAVAGMWQDVGDLPAADQARLGLARVAGICLVARHNARPTPFAADHPRGLAVDCPGSAGMGRWVRRAWRRRFGADFDDE